MRVGGVYTQGQVTFGTCEALMDTEKAKGTPGGRGIMEMMAPSMTLVPLVLL